MVKFYETIDVYINISTLEGFSQCLLEAAATGLPIICTDIGGHSKLVDKEWLIPAYPEEEMLKQLNEKLTLLKNNPKLRMQVGQRNLNKVQNKWAWKYIVKEYERMFEDDVEGE
jgi:glycosyltransferase involved in cell wall biosynthesis